jgi:hypothetical protein
MVSDVIIVALITGICSVIGQWLISKQQADKKKVEDIAREVRLDERLKGVEKKLDEHNGYAKRFEEIQTDIAVIKNDIKTLYRTKEN